MIYDVRGLSIRKFLRPDDKASFNAAFPSFALNRCHRLPQATVEKLMQPVDGPMDDWAVFALISALVHGLFHRDRKVVIHAELHFNCCLMLAMDIDLHEDMSRTMLFENMCVAELGALQQCIKMPTWLPPRVGERVVSMVRQQLGDMSLKLNIPCTPLTINVSLASALLDQHPQDYALTPAVRPYVPVSCTTSKITKVCVGCGVPVPGVVCGGFRRCKCGACGNTYCSHECQVADWPDHRRFDSCRKRG